MSKIKSNPFLFLKLAVYIIVPLVLILLPANYFDEGSNKCLSIILLDMECLGCGMTRACMHFIHLNFTEAISYNFLVVIVFPMLAFIWGMWFWGDFKKWVAD